MLTQIEIDGFKTFKDFKVELAPFQVIVGPNGSGKSNLFDALDLLSRLADTDLLSAFQGLHGDVDELFTRLPDGKSVDRLRMAVELLVDRKVQDSLGEEAELKYTRLRYELEIRQRSDEHGLEQLYVIYESLRSIPQDEDTWCKKYGLSSQNKWLPSPIGDQTFFISTTLRTSRTMLAEAALPYDSKEPLTAPVPDITTINLHQDGQRPGKFSRADKVKRTVLSSVTDTDFPHALAVREEMRSWRFLHLNPEVLRLPSSTKAPPFLSPEGKNMPTTLARMQAEDKFALTDVSRDMANLASGILKIRVEQDKPNDKYVIYAETSDERSFSSQVLSDGTLRLLALATLRNDPQFRGVLCIEEPENGVDPLRLKNMARVLREMATNFTDFNEPEQVNEPLRQVLISTYSPSFISQPDVIDSLLFTIMPTRIQGKSAPAIQVTRMVPVATPSTPPGFETNIYGDKAVEFYTIDMIRKYLDSDTLDEARNQLKKARSSLNER